MKRKLNQLLIVLSLAVLCVMLFSITAFADDDFSGLFNNTMNIQATTVDDQALEMQEGTAKTFNDQTVLQQLYSLTGGSGNPQITQGADGAYTTEMPVVLVTIKRTETLFKLSLVDLLDEPDVAFVYDLTMEPVGALNHLISNEPAYWTFNAHLQQQYPDVQSGEEIQLPVVSGKYIAFDYGYMTSAIIEFRYKEDEECIAAIDALPETITLNDLEVVKAARAKYDALAQYEGAQDNISNYARLTAAEEAIANLVKGEADPVKETISFLPKASDLTLNDKAAVEAARASYDALSSEAKEYVENITTLVLAEATIAKLEAQAELAQAKDALNQALENAEPEEDIDKLTDQVKQAKADLKEANEELTVAKETVKIQKVVIKKLKAKAQKKKTTVSWKSAGQGYQYEVYKSTKMSKGFKKAVTTKKVKAVVKKLKSKKTYYVKVRAFKVVNGSKVYTQYSDTVKVKVK